MLQNRRDTDEQDFKKNMAHNQKEFRQSAPVGNRITDCFLLAHHAGGKKSDGFFSETAEHQLS